MPGAASPFRTQPAQVSAVSSSDLAAEANRVLDETEGEFLPGWEEIETETNGGRGGAAEYVRTLRQVADTARVDIMGALAANHLARQEPRKAIPLLEQALERQPERDGVDPLSWTGQQNEIVAQAITSSSS